MPGLATQIAHEKYIQLNRIFKITEGCVEDRRCTEYKKQFYNFQNKFV